MSWKPYRMDDVTIGIDIDCEKNSSWEQWCLLTADRHLDNPHSDRVLQKLHLEQAREKGAFVIDVGDLFCAMQGRNDRRGSKSDLMTENKKGSYLNSLVKTNYNFLQPYSDLFAVICNGNHETAILKHNEFGLIESLVEKMNEAGSPVLEGGYRGYIKLRFIGNEKSAFRNNKIIYYHHGGGGGGPVTKGVIKTNRRSIGIPNSDFIISGHIHEQWSMTLPHADIDQRGKEYLVYQEHIQIPSYKDEFTNIAGGFAHEREAQPKPKGAWWLRFYYSSRRKRIEAQSMKAEI